MLKRLKHCLTNNRGDALVFGVIVSMVVLLFFYCVLTFTQLKITTAHIQNTAEQVLDTYTSTQGRNAVQSFKNGTDYTVILDGDLYTQRLQDALGVNTDFIGYGGDEVRFQISDITLDYSVDNTINSSVSFHLREPLYLFGTEVTELDDTVTVRSKYNVK